MKNLNASSGKTNPLVFDPTESRKSRLLFLAGLSMLFVLISLKVAFGQTNPTAQSIPYSQNFAGFGGASTVYPAGLQGWTVPGSLSTSYLTAAPSANQNLAGGTNATTTAGIYDFNTKAGIVSTGSNTRALVLAINTIGHTFIAVSFTAATQNRLNAGRINELGLQYRIGTSGTFTNLTGSTYQNANTSTINTGTASTDPATVAVYLPAACDGQAVVQLRWVIRDVSGGGNRPTFSVDDISVTADVPPIVVDLNTISPASLTEGAGPWTIQATAASAVPANSTINIAISGPITGELTTGDYTLGSSTLVINSGNTVSSSTTLSITDDAFCEGNESITVTLTTSAFGVAIGTNTQTLTIADNASDLVFPLPVLNSPSSTITFNTLALSGLSPNLSIGLYMLEQGTNANKTYAADPGGTNSGNIYSYGAAASSERALGSLGSGSLGHPTGGDQTLGIFYGFKLANTTGSTINGLTVDYFGELWTKQGSLVDEIKFQYSTNATSINTGTWNTVSALTFTPSVDLAGYAGIANGAVNGDLPANRVQKAGTFLFGSNIPNGGTVWIRWFDYNSVGNDDGYGIDDLILTPINLSSSNFYSKSTGGLDDLTTWGSNIDGSGSQPPSFSFPGLVLNVRNQVNATINVNWTVNGASSKIVVNNGSNLTIPAGLTLTGTVDVNSGGTLTLNNPSSYPIFGALASNSTVVFSAGSAQTIPSGTYGNLTVSGGGTKTFSGLPIIIQRNFTISNAVTDYGVGSFTIGGNVTYTGIVTHLLPTNSNSFILNGTGVQTISTNGNTLRCFNFSSTKTKGGVTLTAATTVDARNSVFLKFTGSSLFSDGGATLTGRNNLEFDGNASNYNLTGTTVLNFDQTSGSGNVRNNSTNNFAAVARFYNLVLLNNGTGTATDIIIRGQNSYGTTVRNNLTIGGSSTLGGVDEQNASKIYIGGAFINNRVEAVQQSDFNGKTIFYGSGTVNITAGTIGGNKTQKFDTLIVSRANAPIIVDGDLVLDGGMIGSGSHVVTLPANKLVNFIGSSSANILQGSFTIDRVLSSNTSVNGLKLEPNAVLNIGDVLSFATNGKVTTTGGTLRFLSSASNTARINVAPSGASIIGNVTIERYVPSKGWHFTGTIAGGQKISDWNDDFYTQGPMPGVRIPNPGSNTSSIFKFNQAGTLNDGQSQFNGWEVPTVEFMDPSLKSEGYRVFIPNALTLDNTGPISLGDKTLNLDWSGSTAWKGYNLIMNPHASAINWNAATRNNVDNTVVIWDPATSSYKYFGSDIFGGSLGAPTGALNPIASGQAFFVRANGPAPTVSIPEAAKVVGGTFFRSATNEGEVFKIELSNAEGKSDVALFNFLSDATSGHDTKYDAGKWMNSFVNVYTLTEGRKLAINALPFEGEQMTIPVGLNSPAGAYTFNFSGLSALENVDGIFLRDNETAQLVDLKTQPFHSFTLGQAGEENGRFEIIFTNGLTNFKANQIQVSSSVIYPNPVSGSHFRLSLANAKGEVQIEMTDVMGRILSKTNYSISNDRASLQFEKPARAGQYYLRVQTPSSVQSHTLVVY